jgi:hypothetical protein
MRSALLSIALMLTLTASVALADTTPNLGRVVTPDEISSYDTTDELYAVSAYVLQLNGSIGKDDVMNAQTLPKVRMPNRDGFKPWVRGE